MAAVGESDGIRAIRRLLRDDGALREVPTGATTHWMGRVFEAQTVGVRLPDGTEGEREIAWHHGGCGVCAVIDGRMCLVRQYRLAMGAVTLEIPAGRREEGESPEDCAARELGEETGLVAERLELVARAAGSPGFTSETTCIYLAHGLSPHAAHPDEGELVDVHWMPVRDVVEAILEGLICDSKTIIAAQAALIRGPA
ncbi:MAG: NUDIX hydrolase [Olsenella sp.]|jgi:ADP-ribose pyrophosphatase|nr:NUDIX hydrolase [Olsenella sp.]